MIDNFSVTNFKETSEQLRILRALIRDLQSDINDIKIQQEQSA